ncbi:MAG: hypothetical protein FWB99_04365, partial [Treponema sp.]|nr:hypothetical protein [Treponema sp.]
SFSFFPNLFTMELTSSLVNAIIYTPDHYSLIKFTEKSMRFISGALPGLRRFPGIAGGALF